MEPCKTRDCVTQRLQEQEDLASGGTNLVSSNQSFQILFPILIVFSVILVAGIIFLTWIIVKLVRDNCRSENSSDTTEEDSTSVHIQTISEDVELPTYSQMIRDIETGQAPPLYKDLNVVFLSDFTLAGRHIENQLRHDPPKDGSAGFKPILNENTENELAIKTSNEAMASTATSQLVTQTVPDLPLQTVATIDASSNLSNEETVSIVISDIDDIINSISVPSILFTEDRTQKLESAAIGHKKRKTTSNNILNKTFKYLSFKKENVLKTPSAGVVVNSEIVSQRIPV